MIVLITWLTCLWPLGQAAATECVFPTDWRGVWYDSRLKEIDIRVTSISQKGTCLQRDGNKYLMLNKGPSNQKCFQCIVFTQWHPNLLQYKESPCWHEESLPNLCKEITSDIPLQTVVRILSIPVPCPFQGSYTFSYANGSSVECYQPASQIRACADDSKFRFVYKQCNGIRGTSNQELEFQCLATWENGEKFLYGKFVSPSVPSAETSYRCFMHSLYGTTGDMSMSADATCQGLQSPSLGVLTMKLNKDMGSHRRGSCKFPNVLVNKQRWQDLTGNYRLEVDHGLQVLRIRKLAPSGSYRYAVSTDDGVAQLVFRCADDIGMSASSLIPSHQYIAFTTDSDCISEKKCLQFRMRSTYVIEIVVGVLADDESTCLYEDGPTYLVIPETLHTSVCPPVLSGAYRYTDKTSVCSGEVTIGCFTNDEIEIKTTCSGNKKSVRYYKCLQSWQESEVTYVIVRSSGNQSNSNRVPMCLAFMDTEYGIEVQASSSCQGDRSIVNNQYLNYLLYAPPDKCKALASSSSSASPKSGNVQSDQNANNAGGGNNLIDANDDPTSDATSINSAILTHIHVIVTSATVVLHWTSNR